MTISENFSRNFSTAIEARKLTKVKVAENAKTSRSYVDKVMKNEVDPCLERAEILAKAVGFPFAALIVEPEEFEKSVLTTVSE